jgi:hypothetical protein
MDYRNYPSKTYEEQLDAEFKKQMIEYLKQQKEFIDGQKIYSASIKTATWVMAAAIIGQFTIMTIGLILR